MGVFVSEQLSPTNLKYDPRNARRHTPRGVGQIERSIQHEGFGRSILISSDDVIAAGNATYEAATSAGIDKVRVIETDGTEIIAVKRTDIVSGTPEFTALAVADNRAGEHSDFDPEILQALIDDDLIEPDEFWFPDELDELMAGDGEPGGTLDVSDDVGMPPADPITRLGDIWELGQHRVMCGDAGSSFDRDVVTGGVKAETLFYDPPWDIDIAVPTSGYKSTLAFTDGRRAGDVINQFGAPTWVFVWDCVTTWYTQNRPLQRMKLCLWYGDFASFNFNGAFYGEPGTAQSGVNSRGAYDYVPDPRGKHIADVFQQSIAQLHGDSEHKHSKPVDWIRLLIGTTSSGAVFDPFLGSGTSLLACEQLGRPCVGLELDPGYCDLVVTRWEEATGNTATRHRRDG